MSMQKETKDLDAMQLHLLAPFVFLCCLDRLYLAVLLHLFAINLVLLEDFYTIPKLIWALQFF
jgi:hypothetical protein